MTNAPPMLPLIAAAKGRALRPQTTMTMDHDRAYANGAFIAEAETFPPKWEAAARAFRTALGPRARLALPYGPQDRQRFDLFLPETQPRGLLVFVHGGYWMAFGRESWSHLAAGALARGWACAMPSYTLAPAATIPAMTQEIAHALAAASAQMPGLPLVVTGHSAGGHLAARMGCTDLSLAIQPARVVPISPLADLAPLLHTQMNDTLGLTPQDARAESPALHALRPGTTAHIWVGGQERPAFLWQARTLSEAWGCPWTVDPGRHHFDVIDGLADPASPLCAACFDGI